MKIVQVKIEELRPAEYNPRKMSEKQVEDLTESIKEFGLVDPLIVNKHKGRENVVIGGHQRLKIASILGFKTIPVVYVDLDEKRERELNIRLNKNLGEWNWDLLSSYDVDFLKMTGFTSQEIDIGFGLWEDGEGYSDKDRENIKTDIRVGDLFKLGEHRLLCGDATSADDFSKLMRGEKAKLIFTDPPYNVNYASASGGGYDSGKYIHKKIFNDNLSDEECLKFYSDILKNLYDWSCDDVSIYWWFATKNDAINRQAFRDTKWHISQVIIWLKNGIVLAPGQDYHRCYEPAFFGWKKGNKHFKINGYKEKEVWTLDNQSFEDQLDIWIEKRDITSDYEHPTQKPIKLAERAFRKNSARRDIVVDCFGGSGSTLIGCEQMERKCRMMELDPYYCQIIINRWQKLTNKKAKKI